MPIQTISVLNTFLLEILALLCEIVFDGKFPGCRECCIIGYIDVVECGVGMTTTSVGQNLVKVTLTMTFSSKAWKSTYATTTSTDFKSLSTEIAALYASSVGSKISGFVSYSLTKAESGSVKTTGDVTIDTNVAGTTNTATLATIVAAQTTSAASTLGVTNIASYTITTTTMATTTA